MGWGSGEARGRQVGYTWRAKCDWPGCGTMIDRGLAYCCGGMHGDNECGCGNYFCAEHRKGVRREYSPASPRGYRYVEVCNDCAKPPSKRRKGEIELAS